MEDKQQAVDCQKITLRYSKTFVEGQLVWFKYYTKNSSYWEKGRITEQLSPTMFTISCKNPTTQRHTNQIRPYQGQINNYDSSNNSIDHSYPYPLHSSNNNNNTNVTSTSNSDDLSLIAEELNSSINDNSSSSSYHPRQSMYPVLPLRTPSTRLRRSPIRSH